MTVRVGIAGALAAVALAAADARADAGVRLTGSLTGGLSGQSYAGPEIDRTGTRTEWAGNLNLVGGFLNPAVLAWGGGVNYASTRWVFLPNEGSRDALGYHANLSLFSRSWLPLQLMAGRTFTDNADTNGAATRIGTALTTAYSAATTLGGNKLPTLRFALRRTETDAEQADARLIETDTTGLNVTLAQALPSHEYSLGYESTWNAGTYDETNFRAQDVNLVAAARVGETARVNVMDRYFSRVPTLRSPLSPQYDMNDLRTSLQWRTERVASSLTFGTSDILIAGFGPNPLRSSRTSRNLGYGALWNVSKELVVVGNVTGTSALSSDGRVSVGGLGQNVGLGLQWQSVRGAWELQAGAGGTAGVVEPDTGGLESTYGASLFGGSALRLERSRFGGYYTVSYADGGAGLSGWTLSQMLRLDGEGRRGNLILTGTLAANGARRDDAVLGSFLNRRLTFNARLAWFRWSLVMNAGFLEGLDAPLDAPGSDGLFLPVAFNTLNRYGSIGGEYRSNDGRATLGAQFRAANVRAPLRAELLELGLVLTGSYAIGKVVLSLDARSSYGSVGEAWQRGTIVMVRASRAFGGGF